jgi:membrane-associated phospholipid phosphatase
VSESRALGAAGAWAAAAYIGLTWAVATGHTEPADEAVYDLFRPGGTCGWPQEFLGDVANGARPVVCLFVLGVVVAWTAMRRRSWQPIGVAALLTAPTAAVVIATKWIVDRTDPAGGFVPHDGSFPSGHTAIILVCTAGVALVLRWPGSRPWSMVVVVAIGAMMAYSLLVVGLHWLSDVVGGALLALSVLTACMAILRATAGPDSTADDDHVDPDLVDDLTVRQR